MPRGGPRTSRENLKKPPRLGRPRGIFFYGSGRREGVDSGRHAAGRPVVDLLAPSGAPGVVAAMKNAFRTGERICLRPLEVEDGEQLRAWLNDPETHQYLALHRPLSAAAER